MKWEYTVIGLLLMTVVMVVIYLVGERTWSKSRPNTFRRLSFVFYRMINRLKRIKAKNYKNVIMLHLMKVSDEITNPNPDFNKAKRVFDFSTVFTLIDIYDDGYGKRYLKISDEKYGDFIFEIMEYVRVAYNKEIKDREIKNIDSNEKDLVKELGTRPMLKVMK